MKYGCPNQNCKFHKKTTFLVKDGSYRRKSDSKIIPRYRCKKCGKKFSNATFSLAKGQRKRRINPMVFKLLCSGVSIRRTAKIVGVNQKTVARKLEFLAQRSRIRRRHEHQQLMKNKVSNVQFDDLITSIHTKLKPLSVSIAVEEKTRRILAVEVSQIAAFGHLAEKSRKKYGYRKSFHKKGLERMFRELEQIVKNNAVIKSDEHSFYAPTVRRFFPKCEHIQYKGGRGCVVGQGELKRLYFDPLFSLNHTCAMLRENLNRLKRKTWSTTKNIERLKDHLDMYVEFHNRNLKTVPI